MSPLLAALFALCGTGLIEIWAFPDSERNPRLALSRSPSVEDAMAAKQLGVSVPTVRRRIKDGSLRAVRVGRAWRVDTTSLATKSDDEITTLAFRARNGSSK